MYNNNQNNNQNPYNYPPNPNVPYQNMNQNNDAYYQSNPNMYAPPYQQNPYQNPPPPYQKGYAPQQDQIYVQVPVVQQQIIVESGINSREPQAFYCPYCLTNVVTEVHYEPGDKTSLMACCLCFFGGVICCLIPYCVNDCQDAIHLCPLCRCTLGRVPF